MSVHLSPQFKYTMMQFNYTVMVFHTVCMPITCHSEQLVFLMPNDSGENQLHAGHAGQGFKGLSVSFQANKCYLKHINSLSGIRKCLYCLHTKKITNRLLSINQMILLFQPLYAFVLHWLVVTLALEIYHQKRGIWG